MKLNTLPQARRKAQFKQSRGLFVTFEGIEGSGKSTQCHQLAKTLSQLGYAFLETREPGGTPCAEQIRTILLDYVSPTDRPEPMTPECETALVLAARSQHIKHRILPALAKGMIVLCDRFTDSTLAYQGFGRNLDIPSLHEFNTFVTHGLTPDLTLLFDLPIAQGLKRRQRERNQNRLDRESKAFHNRVRKGFLTLASQFPQRIVVINGKQSQADIASSVLQYMTDLMKKQKFQSPSA